MPEGWAAEGRDRETTYVPKHTPASDPEQGQKPAGIRWSLKERGCMEHSLLGDPVMKRHFLTRTAAVLVALALAAPLACSNDDGTTPAPGPTRTYRMGFSGIPPTNDLATAIAAIDMWSTRADAAILSFELPWDSLLAGVPPQRLIANDQRGLAQYYRSKGHKLWIYLDPANGLNRAGESTALVNAGRSITEPAIQHMFRRYAV